MTERCKLRRARFDSLDDLIARTGVRRDELATLAEVGTLNTFGYDRRMALWQIERAVKKEGALLKETGDRRQEIGGGAVAASSPLPKMTPVERMVADYAVTRLTIGPHPMSFHRREFALRGVLRAVDLSRGRHGCRVRVAGAVITRQRPGTAKGFVFLTLEDETGIANIIVQPSVFAEQKTTILDQPFLLVEGRLQIQDGVISIKAERCRRLWTAGPDIESHNFH